MLLNARNLALLSFEKSKGNFTTHWWYVRMNVHFLFWVFVVVGVEQIWTTQFLFSALILSSKSDLNFQVKSLIIHIYLVEKKNRIFFLFGYFVSSFEYLYKNHKWLFECATYFGSDLVIGVCVFLRREIILTLISSFH